MAENFEQMLKEIFGESFNKISQFQSDKVKQLMDRVREMAREAIKDDLTRLEGEITTLRERVTTLEAERAEKAAEGVDL